jgi:hypothetical protein
MADDTTQAPGSDPHGERRIDPRFDAAFQPGFRGNVTTTRRRPSPGVPSVVPAQQAARAQVPPTSLPSTLLPPAEAAPVAGDPAPQQTPDAAPATPRGANPFVIVLWVMAAALVLGGGWGVQSARAADGDDAFTSTSDYFAMQVLVFGAPIALALGVATAIGLLFLSAVNWRKRRG